METIPGNCDTFIYLGGNEQSTHKYVSVSYTHLDVYKRQGININQIVFNNNAGLYSKEDKTQLVAYMRKLNKKVNEAVVQIGNQ